MSFVEILDQLSKRKLYEAVITIGYKSRYGLTFAMLDADGGIHTFEAIPEKKVDGSTATAVMPHGKGTTK